MVDAAVKACAEGIPEMKEAFINTNKVYKRTHTHTQCLLQTNQTHQKAKTQTDNAFQTSLESFFVFVGAKSRIVDTVNMEPECKWFANRFFLAANLRGFTGLCR